MIVYSSVDQQELAGRLWREQVRFYTRFCSAWIKLGLYPIGWSAADAQRLVAALASLRNQVQVLASPSQIQFGTA